MVTFAEVYNVNSGESVPIQTEGCFVLPITWLFVALKTNQIQIDDALLLKKNFTDEMLLNLIVDFKSMSWGQFLNSRYGNVSFAVCRWQQDKQWVAYLCEDDSYHQIITKNEVIQIKNVCLVTRELPDRKKKVAFSENSGVDSSILEFARNNLQFAKVLHKFSSNVHYTDELQCSQTIILS